MALAVKDQLGSSWMKLRLNETDQFTYLTFFFALVNAL